MFRTHGRPDLLREDEAIDDLGARIRAVRRVAIRCVVAISLITSAVVAYVAGTFGTHELGLAITGKAIGLLAGSALFGTLFGGQAIAARLTLYWAEGAARARARESRCDEEALVEAVRLLAGGTGKVDR
jgi:hypothetical protein